MNQYPRNEIFIMKGFDPKKYILVKISEKKLNNSHCSNSSLGSNLEILTMIDKGLKIDFDS